MFGIKKSRMNEIIYKYTKYLTQFAFCCKLQTYYNTPMRSLFLIFLFVLLTNCSGDSVNNPNCKFLLDIGVNVTVNMNLPQYSQLQFAGNSVYIANYGNGGIIVASLGNNQYFAWDASDPNHTPSSCSALEISGLEGICGCADHNKYSLVNGQPLENASLQCALKNYRIEQNGNTLLISN